ncbi:MAG TPA: hypothetical protein ENI52_04635 [Thermoplasmata archaeon]|nr:hypothetical protein [Thermoplasmata archaeon]
MMILFKVHETDFKNLILGNFLDFLRVIEYGVKQVKKKNRGKKELYTYMKGRFSNPPCDRFYDYWNLKKDYFVEWLYLDETEIRDERNNLITSYLSKYGELHQKYSFDFDEEREEHVSELYPIILDGSKEYGIEIQNRDAKLLSYCCVYSQHYLPEGILYLVTDDKNLNSLGKKIIQKGELQWFKILSSNELIRKLSVN